MKLSYLVGYGSNYPLQVHHRGASIPTDANTGCKGFTWLESTSPNPNVAVGALVGGPFQNDSFIDVRNNSKQTEPSTYNGAVIVGLLSGLVTTSSVVQSFVWIQTHSLQLLYHTVRVSLVSRSCLHIAFSVGGGFASASSPVVLHMKFFLCIIWLVILMIIRVLYSFYEYCCGFSTQRWPSFDDPFGFSLECAGGPKPG